MDAIRILLSLSENNAARVKVDPKIQLASLYQRVMTFSNAARDAEKKLERLKAIYEENRREWDSLTRQKPLWLEEIEDAKEKSIRKRDLTLKEMLGIQQEVVRLEESVQLAEIRLLELREDQGQYERIRKQLFGRLNELRAEYNRCARQYNQEKAEADLILAEFTAKEERLLAELTEKDRAAYREAWRLNPDSPVAILEGDVCGGCRIGLPKQMVKQVNQGSGLIFCENCMRILLPKP